MGVSACMCACVWFGDLRVSARAPARPQRQRHFSESLRERACVSSTHTHMSTLASVRARERERARRRRRRSSRTLYSAARGARIRECAHIWCVCLCVWFRASFPARDACVCVCVRDFCLSYLFVAFLFALRFHPCGDDDDDDNTALEQCCHNFGPAEITIKICRNLINLTA